VLVNWDPLWSFTAANVTIVAGDGSSTIALGPSRSFPAARVVQGALAVASAVRLKGDEKKMVWTVGINWWCGALGHESPRGDSGM
jgi:hypothetical protein